MSDGQSSGGTEYEEPENSACNTYAVRDGSVNEEGEELFVWSFECTRCGHMTPCKGDPREFAGRPYSCIECGWVSLLEQDTLNQFAEDHYVDTGTDRSEGGDRA